MRVVEEKEAIAGLSIWALICVFDLGAVWPELDVATARWSGAGALAILVATAVLLIVQCFQTQPRDAPRLLLKRPLSLAAHTLLVSGCAVWLTVHAAIGSDTPQVCAGAVALWALLSLSAVRACPLPSVPASLVQPDCTPRHGSTGGVSPQSKDDVIANADTVMPQVSKDVPPKPANRIEPLPPAASPVPMPSAGWEEDKRPRMRKSKSMGASLKDLFSGPWQFREAGGCPANDEPVAIVSRVKKASQRSSDESEVDTALTSDLRAGSRPARDSTTIVSQAEVDPATVESKDIPSTTVLHICELTEYNEDAVLHQPKQGVGASPTEAAVRRISLPIPVAKNSASNKISTVTAPPLLHLPGSRSQSPDQNVAGEPVKGRTAFEPASPQASSAESPEARQSFMSTLNTVNEPTGLKTPDEKELEEKLATEGQVNDDTGLIEAESLRKAILSNLCRRLPKIGDPISGARVEELHEILFRDGDAAWLTNCGESNWSAFARCGDPEDLDKRQSVSSFDDMEPSDLKIDGNMGNDDFQRLRDHFQAVEAGKSANKSPSMWPLLLNSFCGSNMSRRGSYLPGLSGQATEFNSRKGSAVGSRRASRRPSRIFKDSTAGSRLASAQGSRNASRSNSFCIPEATSAAGSRRASRANGDDTAKGSTTTSVVTSRRTSTVAALARNSLMLPVGAQFAADTADDDEDDEDVEVPQTVNSRSSVLQVPDDSDMGSSLKNLHPNGAEYKGAKTRRGTAPTLTMSVPAAVPFYKTKTQPSLSITEEARDSDGPNTSMTEKEDFHTPWKAEVCNCGNIFKHDSVFCRKCGKKREVEVVGEVSVVINGSSVLQIPTVPPARNESPSEDMRSEEDKDREQEAPRDRAPMDRSSVDRAPVESEVDDYEAQKLKTALANKPPEMRLKDLLLGDNYFGDISVECLLRVASDWNRSGKEQAELSGKGIETDDSEDDNSDDFGDDYEDDRDIGVAGQLQGLQDVGVAGQLQGLQMDPSIVSDALKMLMLLNNGFKAKHCTCKDGGPHTCMSPAVSQLASQVHTTLQSLNQSMVASKVVSAVGSRRASVEQGVEQHVRRRRSGGRNSQPTIVVGEAESSPSSVPPPPQAIATRSSLKGSKGHRLRAGKVDFINGDTSFGPADVGAGPSSTSPTEQVDS